MTPEQERLLDRVSNLAGQVGADQRDVLIGTLGAAADKAAVAEYLGGPGAGMEFDGTGPELPDDGRRYALTGPRGVSPFLDKLAPDADSHTISVCGSADLARRLAEAERLGVADDVSFREVDVAAEMAELDAWVAAEADEDVA